MGYLVLTLDKRNQVRITPSDGTAIVLKSDKKIRLAIQADESVRVERIKSGDDVERRDAA